MTWSKKFNFCRSESFPQIWLNLKRILMRQDFDSGKWFKTLAQTCLMPLLETASARSSKAKCGSNTLAFFKMGHSRPLFLYFHLFNTVDSKQIFNMNFADDWIRTADHWYCKRPLYQWTTTTAQYLSILYR